MWRELDRNVWVPRSIRNMLFSMCLTHLILDMIATTTFVHIEARKKIAISIEWPTNFAHSFILLFKGGGTPKCQRPCSPMSHANIKYTQFQYGRENQKIERTDTLWESLKTHLCAFVSNLTEFVSRTTEIWVGDTQSILNNTPNFTLKFRTFLWAE